MAEKQVIKISEEELKKLKELKVSFQDNIFKVGQIELQISDTNSLLDGLNAAKINLVEEYNKIKEEEKVQFKELNEKYGIGSLDINTGLFTPEQ